MRFLYAQPKRVSDYFITTLTEKEDKIGVVYDDKASGASKKKGIASYQEARGTPTIGIGHAIQSDKDREKFAPYLRGGKIMSESEMYDLLRTDLAKYVQPAKTRIKVPITQAMFDSLTSYAYNLGVKSNYLTRTIDKINEKDYEGAAAVIRSGPFTSDGEFMQGLKNRRNAEADWFMMQGTPKVDPIRVLASVSTLALVVGLSIKGINSIRSKS